MEKDIKKVIVILIIGVIIISLLTFHFLGNKKEDSIKDNIDSENILAYTITALHTATDYNVSGGSTTGSYS